MKEAGEEKPSMKFNDKNKDEAFAEYRKHVFGWMKAAKPVLRAVMEEMEKPEGRKIEEEKGIQQQFGKT